MRMEAPNDDYDNPWKIAIGHYFREFLAIFCPWLEAAIDWSVEPTYHDQELRQVTRDAKSGLRRLDKLAKVRLLDGSDLYIHLEVQLCRQRGFGRRMFTYNMRLFDRYGCAVASIAILADRCPNWRPRDFWCEAHGTRIGIEFTSVKLMDYCPPPVGYETNCFALVARAHFETMRTRRDPDARLVSKILLVKEMYVRAWPKQRIIDLLDVLDWLMRLPGPQKAGFEAALSELERRFDMPYMNSMVRDAIARGEAQGRELGMQQGLQQGLQQGMQRGLEQGIQVGELKGRREALKELLVLRFGRLDDAIQLRIGGASEEELSLWMGRAISASSLDDVLPGE